MTIEQSILEVIRALPPEKQREVLEHAKELRASIVKRPRKSGRGLWADLNISLSAEDIDAARREMWKSFPRDFRCRQLWLTHTPRSGNYPTIRDYPEPRVWLWTTPAPTATRF